MGGCLAVPQGQSSVPLLRAPAFFPTPTHTGGSSASESQRPERVSRRGSHADVAAAAAASLDQPGGQTQPHRPKALRPGTVQQGLVTSGGFPLFRGPGGQPFFAAAAGGTPGSAAALQPATVAAADPTGLLAQWVQRYNRSIAEMMGGQPAAQQQSLATAAALYAGMFGGAVPPGAFMAAARPPVAAAPPQAAAGMVGDLGPIVAAALPMLGALPLFGGGHAAAAPASAADQLARLLQAGGAPALAAAMQQAAAPAAAPAAGGQAAALQLQLQAMMQMANTPGVAALMAGVQGIPPQLVAMQSPTIRSAQLAAGLPPPAPLHPAAAAAGGLAAAPAAAPPPLFAPPPASGALVRPVAVSPLAAQQAVASTSLTAILQATAQQQLQGSAALQMAGPAAPLKQQQQQPAAGAAGPSAQQPLAQAADQPASGAQQASCAAGPRSWSGSTALAACMAAFCIAPIACMP